MPTLSRCQAWDSRCANPRSIYRLACVNPRSISRLACANPRSIHGRAVSNPRSIHWRACVEFIGQSISWYAPKYLHWVGVIRVTFSMVLFCECAFGRLTLGRKDSLMACHVLQEESIQMSLSLLRFSFKL